MKLKFDRYLILGMIWLLLCLLSFSALNWYKTRPGPVGKISAHWPENISLEYHRNFYNLVLFAHPKCPCTSASLIELEKLITETKKNMQVSIFFYHPKGTSSDWSKGESKSMASEFPMTKIYDDEGGETAYRFGAMTSGQTMVYSPEGELVYSGGLTESRGHVGTTLGALSIANVVANGVTIINKQQTFGCALFSENEMKASQKL